MREALSGNLCRCTGYQNIVDAVMTAALNVACAGGEPIALTDCLNFGNPERPEIAWELSRAIDGITDAANELGIPVVSDVYITCVTVSGSYVLGASSRPASLMAT